MSGVQEQLRRIQAALEAQEAVAGVLAEAATLAEATPRLLQAIGQSLDWELGALWSVDARAAVLRCERTWHAPGTDAEDFERLSLERSFAPGVGLPGRTWSRAEPQWIPDVLEDDNFPRARAAARAGLHAALGFPIHHRAEVLGVMEFFSHEVREPSRELLARMGSFGSQIGQYIVRRRAEEAVHRSEARKAAILESALDCVITMDHEGRIVEFNPAAERTFGYARDYAIGREMAALVIPPSLRSLHRRALTRYLETGEARLLNRRLELTGMRADGTEFPVELTITRIDLEGPPMFTGYIRDATDRKRGERDSALLTEASKLLSGTLDYETTLENIAKLAVPAIADWCSVDRLDPGGRIKNLAVAHAEPAKRRLTEKLRQAYPEGRHSPGPTYRVLHRGEPELQTEVGDDLLRKAAPDPEARRLLRAVGMSSAMTVPMAVRGRRLGAITLVAGESGRRYGEKDLALCEELARRAAMALENARLYGERSHIARTLQESLLPSRIPEIPGFEVGALFRASGEANEVGGDFYDLFQARDGEWAAVIGDVSGKGAAAAAVTALARYTLRAVALQESRPSEVLRLLNDAMLRPGSDERFCTVAFARLRAADQGATAEVATGGHPLPLLVRTSGVVEPVGRPGLLMGVKEDPLAFDHQVMLGPGDKLVFYTDGVTEARVGEGMLGLDRLCALLASCPRLDAAATAERIEQAAVRGPYEPRDDIAVLVLEAQRSRRPLG
jgi:PAS domain S-box-containing protein